MKAVLTFFWNLVPLLLAMAFTGWLLWQWLKRSDEPGALIGRWVITLVVVLPVILFAARARDEFSKIAAILVAAVAGVIMAIVWGTQMCEFVANRLGSLYTGGNQEVEPAPFYSVAQGLRKRGKYLDAIAEVRYQLERFPTDFQGWMLLAEIQAEDLKDLSAAHETIEQLLSQEGRAPKNIAFALNREADWQLKFHQDADAAGAILRRIVDLLPDTEQAQLALQRLAHLPSKQRLQEREEPRRVVLQRSDARIGLGEAPRSSPPPDEDPAVTAANYVKQLEQFPFDNETREKLALIYARHYRRLDLAADQLEQLIAFPNQPAKQVVGWLNLLADLQIELDADEGSVRETLKRILELYPNSAAAETALNRLAHLKLEFRPKQASQVVKLGSYEQNLGLKMGPGGPEAPG
jgi:hypothetical protein